MNYTLSLADYREMLGLSQDELVVMIGRAGSQNLAGEPAIGRLTISKAECGRTISRKSAHAIAMGLSLAYEQRGKPERFVAEDILALVRREAQKRAEKKQESPDSPNDDKALDHLAVAV